MKAIPFILLTLLSSSALANCYKVGDMAGYTVREQNDYALNTPSESKQVFEVTIDGKASGVSPSDIDCTLGGGNTLICFHVGEGGESVIETWALYPEQARALYTKTINGYGTYNGGTLFVGTILGQCETP
ncbi:hypothetical protein [Thaumasiovibrio subtropicus]|uniref:hypothetical protein n=1 Tax=Thaumasiovibrio subtropicus TaxID=1891207 RepID=UPI000B35BD61|nr:hypothetical protein [Thaumasiovibrio subtropicus]